MKRIILLALVLVMLVSCIGLVACGDGDENGTASPPPSNEVTNSTPSVPSEDDFTWNDIPVYPGAKPVQKGTWAIPPAEGEWSRVEWHYYETSGSVGEVAIFYKSKMPANGWQEAMWMETQEMNWGLYNKNNEQDSAMAWIGSEEGETFFALMRASQ